MDDIIIVTVVITCCNKYSQEEKYIVKMNKCSIVMAMCIMLAITSTACKNMNSDVKVDVKTNVKVDVNENANVKADVDVKVDENADVKVDTDVKTDTNVKVDKSMNALAELGMNAERVTIDIDEVTEEYTFLFFSDLHVVNQSEEVVEKETVDGRISMYTGWNGLTSTENWKLITEALGECDADGVLLGGDMVDFASAKNLTQLNEGLQKLKTPFMYVRADHDTEAFYCDEKTKWQTEELHSDIDGNEEIFLWEYDEFCVVGVNFSTSQLSESAVDSFEQIYELGKPIILMIHVPVNSLVDDSLAMESKKVWTDRNLTWGVDCHYYPDNNTSRFLELIYEEDSLVKEILGGHLHFEWDGKVTDTVYQHVFKPACEGYYGIVTVK